MKMTLLLGWTVGLLVLPITLSAQSVRSLINGGNDLYDQQKYTDAEVNYRKALDQERGIPQGHFNLGDALYKQGKFAEAAREYENALQKSQDKEAKAFAYYNIGNSLIKGQDVQNAIKAYIQALKLKPDDQETKHNLSYALRMLQQQQQQQQQKNDKKQQDNKQNQQNQQDQQKKQDQQQEQKQQQQQNQEQERQQASRQQKQISKEDAERILAVLKNSEKDVQKKLRARQATRPKTEKDW